MNKKLLVSLAACSIVTFSTALWAMERNFLLITGSSTIYPYAQSVAQELLKAKAVKPPKIISTGTGRGIEEFCKESKLTQSPDVVNASRRMKKEELETCIKNGYQDVAEIKLGYDALVIAGLKQAAPLALHKNDLYLALAAKILQQSDNSFLAQSPYSTWNQVNPQLPEIPISVIGPPLTTGTRDSFVEMVMLDSCGKIPFLQKIKKDNERNYLFLCEAVRKDGAFIDLPEDGPKIMAKLASSPTTVAIMNYHLFQEYGQQLQAVSVEGQTPEFAKVASGAYPLTRPLYVYVKKSRLALIPDLAKYLAELTSEAALGEQGYLTKKGLVPVSATERAQGLKQAQELPALTLP